jgi:hypothetical protein
VYPLAPQKEEQISTVIAVWVKDVELSVLAFAPASVWQPT